MIDSEEKLQIVDKANNPVGEATRTEAHLRKLWHRTAHVWLINPRGEILCQKRSLKKDNKPGLWEPFLGGHIGPGDSYEAGAIKEVEEEIGLILRPEQLRLHSVQRLDDSRHFSAVFIVNWDGRAEDLQREEEEIDELRWVSAEVVRQGLSGAPLSGWVYPIGYESEVLGA